MGGGGTRAHVYVSEKSGRAKEGVGGSGREEIGGGGGGGGTC